MGDKSYKKRYIDEIVAKLGPHFKEETDEQLRARAANIFNRSHRFTKKNGYMKKDTIFASSIGNSVKFHVLSESVKDTVPLPDLKDVFAQSDGHSSTFLSNVSLAAIEVGKVDIDPDTLPAKLKASEQFKDMFDRRDDLILLDLILVVEGVNANKDEFISEELERGYRSIIGMPLTEEHLPTEIQGVFYDAQLVDVDVIDPVTEEAEKKKAVRAQAVFYKHRFPDEADVIIGRAAMGTLRFSMECYFEKAECSECGEQYESVFDYCDHLWDRYDPYNTASRKLIGIKFVGGSYVRHPAEKQAVLLDFKDFSSESLVATAASEGKTVYHVEIDDIHFAWSDTDSATQSSDSNIEGDESMDLKTLFAKYPELEASFNEMVQAKANEIVADMEQSSEKEELESTISTLTDEKETLATENQKLKDQIAEREALDRATAFVTTLENEGIDLGSDEEKDKLVALFLKSSDEDAETLMAFLRKTKASDDDESDEGSEEESEASEEDAKDEDSDEEDESDASDEGSEDESDEEKAEADSGTLPLDGDAYEKATAGKYGKHLKRSAVEGISCLAKTFDSENSQ